MKLQQKIPRSDLHCHILPGIDDGAEDIGVSEELLRAEQEMDVSQILCTPHFYADRMSEDDFFSNRKQAEEKLRPLCEQMGIELKVGAEVRMVPQLADVDLSRFVMGDTNYLLLEWPFVMFPLWGEKIVDELLRQGIRPVFAHVERYDYFFDFPSRLDSYIARGALCQTNGGALLHQSTQKRVLQMIRQGRIHVVSSDTHNMDARPPRLDAAFAVVQKQLGMSAYCNLVANADAVFHGKQIESPHIHAGHKIFGLFG